MYRRKRMGPSIEALGTPVTMVCEELSLTLTNCFLFERYLANHSSGVPRIPILESLEDQYIGYGQQVDSSEAWTF
jgi:hypothetical protein